MEFLGINNGEWQSNIVVHQDRWIEARAHEDEIEGTLSVKHPLGWKAVTR